MVCEWTVTASLSHVTVRNVAEIFLPVRPTPLSFSQNDWAKMQQLEPIKAVLLLRLPVILLRIFVSSAALDALAARGMRLTSLTQEGCDYCTVNNIQRLIGPRPNQSLVLFRKT